METTPGTRRPVPTACRLLCCNVTTPNLRVSRKVFLKHQVNWNTVCGAMQDLPSYNIWSADNPVEVLNEHLFCWLDVLFQTRLPVCATRISLGLMINAGILWPQAEGSSSMDP